MFERIFKWLYEKLVSLQNQGASIETGCLMRSLEASVIRACPNCGAKGVDDNNKYVGETCPSCGSIRPPLEDLGVIWKKRM